MPLDALPAAIWPPFVSSRATRPPRIRAVLTALIWLGASGAGSVCGPATRAAAQDPDLLASTLWSSARAVAAIDDVALVFFTAGMATFDVSDPTTPSLLERFDEYDEPPGFNAVQILGNHAFVASGSSGLQVYDLSVPSHPVLVASCDTPGDALDLEIVGDRAYIADGYAGGLQIFSISDSERPRLLGSCSTHGSCFAVAVSGDRAYCAAFFEGIAVIDVADPTNPICGPHLTNVAYPPFDLAISGPYLCAIGSQGEKSIWDPSGMTVYDLSDPDAPIRRGTYHSQEGANAVRTRETLAYIANADGSLTTLDISNPDAPREVSEVEIGGYATGLCLAADRAYVSSDHGVFAVLDLDVPTTPTLLGRWWESSNTCDVQVHDGLAYVADARYGMHVVDVQAAESPVILSHLPLPDGPHELTAGGPYVYVADDSAGVFAVDVSCPEAPAIVGHIAQQANAIASDGRYLYVTARFQGLRVIDALDPQNLTLVGTCPVPNWPSSVSVAGRYACVCNGSAMYVVDILDPTQPTLRGTFDPTESIFRATFDGTYAYASVGNDGLFVIDVTDPDAPAYVTELHFGWNTRGSCLSGNRLYLATQGLRVIDVSEPRHPEIVGSSLMGGASQVAVDGPYAFTAGVGALSIFQVGSPAPAPELPLPPPAGGLELCVSSPAQGAADIVVRLSKPQWLRVGLCNVSGRCLDSLHEGAAPERELRLRWNPDRAPAGVYYVRVVTAAGAWSRPLVLIR